MSRWFIILALVTVVALPFVLRERSAGAVGTAADETLVIITPHNEAIRYEFGQAFAEWYRERTGRRVVIDWRVIGGTSEIARFLESEYIASFQLHWTRDLRRAWSTEVQAAFANDRLPADAPEEARAARAAFLASDVGCGIDLFFGGGTYDFVRQARAGRIVASDIMRRHPEWFTDEVIPRMFAGEEYWDREARWIGCVLSAYGIVYNRDALARLGFAGDEPLHTWMDLQDPRLLGEVAVCDPTKSGSIAKAFENVIQQQMQRRLGELQREPGGRTPAEIEAQAVREGWIDGLRLLQCIGGNARYFTDSSQKPNIDVGTGNSAAGMTIDFYGRQQAEAAMRRGGSDRIGYVTPAGGTVNSVDPIAILRGAAHREAAEAFIEFVLSMEGQKLWNFRPGTPGGPEHFALRRVPVRRDFYAQPAWRDLMSDPGYNPYEEGDRLVYRAGWTGGLFREMSFIVRVMCLDTHHELQEAWTAILAAGRPPEAMAALQELEVVNYAAAGGRVKAALTAKNKAEEIALARELGAHFRAQYAKAAALARAHAVAAQGD